MDLYQAVKTDKCHSSPGRLQVNPDQQGAPTGRIQVPACRSVIGRLQQPGMTTGRRLKLVFRIFVFFSHL